MKVFFAAFASTAVNAFAPNAFVGRRLNANVASTSRLDMALKEGESK